MGLAMRIKEHKSDLRHQWEKNTLMDSVDVKRSLAEMEIG